MCKNFMTVGVILSYSDLNSASFTILKTRKKTSNGLKRIILTLLCPNQLFIDGMLISEVVVWTQGVLNGLFV